LKEYAKANIIAITIGVRFCFASIALKIYHIGNAEKPIEPLGAPWERLFGNPQILNGRPVCSLYLTRIRIKYKAILKGINNLR
jgi:hypothetical protein